MSIGTRLKELREKQGYNKKEIAIKLGLPYTTYNNYETNARDVGSETLRMIANFYNVTIDYILENEKYLDTTNLIKEQLHKTPGMRTLFSAADGASEEDIQKAATFLEIAKKNSGIDQE